MPRIFLKPNSAEYAEEDTPKPQTSICDMPGCNKHADFKAPKDRSLNTYYHFCFEHVQEYNRAWDFFSGMAQTDIEDHMINSIHGDRPTWRYDGFATVDEMLKHKAWQTYHFTDKQPDSEQKQYESPFPRYSPEHEAMAIMALEPPLSLEKIKNRYKELVKKHHPDLHGKNRESEELLKRVNMAYTVLKLAYEKYEKLEK